MGVFLDLATQWRIAQDAFDAKLSHAFMVVDEIAFDTAGAQMKANDQAYFLYLFTRFENEVTKAAKIVATNRSTTVTWSDRRIWSAWSSLVFRDDRNLNFMSQVEVLTDKSRVEYAKIKEYYDSRNKIAHGGIHQGTFVIPDVANDMELLVASFPSL